MLEKVVLVVEPFGNDCERPVPVRLGEAAARIRRSEGRVDDVRERKFGGLAGARDAHPDRIGRRIEAERNARRDRAPGQSSVGSPPFDPSRFGDDRRDRLGKTTEYIGAKGGIDGGGNVMRL